jgi:hypothetical protein
MAVAMPMTMVPVPAMMMVMVMPAMMPMPPMMMVMMMPVMPVADLLHQAGLGVHERLRLGHRRCCGDRCEVGHSSDHGRGESESAEHMKKLHASVVPPERIDAP